MKKDGTVSRTYKLRPILQEIAKEATINTGLVHRERRAYLRGELANMNGLFSLSPGLLGPKFPQVVAAASLARSEIHHYFCHAGQETRKDMKKFFSTEGYQPTEILSLMHELFKLHGLIEKYTRLIENYYVEYLRECDAAILQQMVADCISLTADEQTHTMVVLQSFSSSLFAMNADVVDTIQLMPFRLDWDRLTAIFSGRSFVSQPFAKSPQYVALTKRMNVVFERSNFVDNLHNVIKNYVIPHNVWWYRHIAREIFLLNLTEATDTFSVARYGCAVFHIPRFALMTTHEDCSEEYLLLGESATRYFDSCVVDVNNHVESSVKKLWDNYQSLENQILPVEASNRLGRMHQSKQQQLQDKDKKQTKSTVLDKMPGYESEGYARATISHLIFTKRNLLEVITALKHIGKISVFNREYDVLLFVRKSVVSFLEKSMQSVIFRTDELERPSLSLQRTVIGVQTVQDVMAVIDGDISSVRNLFFQSFVSMILPPPGAATRLQSIPGESYSGALIWQISSWFVKMVDLAANTNSGMVYVASQKIFTRTKEAYPIDLVLNLKDMKCLCTLVGAQGIRIICAEMLRVVSQKVGYNTAFYFIKENFIYFILFLVFVQQ